MYIMGQLQKINVVAQISDIATKHARTLPCDTALECDSAIEIQDRIIFNCYSKSRIDTFHE